MAAFPSGPGQRLPTCFVFATKHRLLRWAAKGRKGEAQGRAAAEAETEAFPPLSRATLEGITFAAFHRPRSLCCLGLMWPRPGATKPLMLWLWQHRPLHVPSTRGSSASCPRHPSPPALQPLLPADIASHESNRKRSQVETKLCAEPLSSLQKGDPPPAGSSPTHRPPGCRMCGARTVTLQLLVPGRLAGSGRRVCPLPFRSAPRAKEKRDGPRSIQFRFWEAATCKRLHIFTGYRDAVLGLSFRKGTHQLYSASHDRCVKVWNVAENAYVETLFGHQGVITGLDSLSRECCVTAGGRDGTVRLWKIPEESQLVFCGHQGSIDCIQLINEEHMVLGADDGSVALWGLTKKKPLTLARQAHGTQEAQGLQQPYWISAVAALHSSDLLATGVRQLRSHSSSVKLWKCGEGFWKLEPLWDIPLVGFVNSLKFSAAGDFLVAGRGQEHRLRRWWRVKEAKKSICIIPLKRKAAAPSPKAPDSS
ncbi:U3 small nucleolar RNA-interacting protein 2-like [Leptosomus discolor]